ncbi:MAG: NosD domain-containing protein [Methanosarcinaceae archaeon]|nr:NosD domain-containing protein [Methanosarcinaceae archaeon]
MNSQKKLVLFGIGAVLLMLTANTAFAKELFVAKNEAGENYTSIQAAVKNASSGDTILVYPGTYLENIEINKPDIKLKAISENPKATIVSSNFKDNVFNISANDISIQGFTIKNASFVDEDVFMRGGIVLNNVSGVKIVNNNLQNNYIGIELLNSSNNVLLNNEIQNNNEIGIGLLNSNNNELFNNEVSKNDYGIGLSNSINNELFNNEVSETSYGVYLLNSNENIINANTIHNNWRGISLYYSENCKIIGNTDYNNSYGTLLYNSNENIIDSNEIRNTYCYGFCLENSENCEIKGNTAKNILFSIYIYNSNENIIDSNEIYNDSMNGITLYHSENCEIKGNTAKNNSNGIYLDSSKNCRLSENIVSDNNYIPVYRALSKERNLLRSEELDLNKQEQGFGIALINSPGSILTENKALNNRIGIWLDESGSTSLTKNTALYNNYGISLDYSDNCSLTENRASYNNEKFSQNRDQLVVEFIGLFIISSENCNLEGNIAQNNNIGICVADGTFFLKENWAQNNELGICLIHSKDSVLTGNSVQNSTNLTGFVSKELEIPEAGIGLFECENATFKNNKIIEGNCGIYLLENRNCTLSSNIISENKHSGIYFKDSNDNISIFNNYFENLNNTNFFTESQTLTWNLTKTNGKNILGGPYFGGNYWGTPNGTGWSQLCPDENKDGICDTPYNLTANFTDFLPLKEIPAPEKENFRESGHTPRYIPPPSESSGVQAVETGQQRAKVGQETQLTFKGETSGVLGLSFTSEKYTGIVLAQVEVLEPERALREIEAEIKDTAKKAEVSELSTPKGVVLRYMNIKVGNERFESSENLKKGFITFKVAKSWIKENKIDESTIALNRFHAGEWNRLLSEKTGEDEEFAYFKAQTPGFSLYSITGDSINSEPIENKTLATIPENKPAEKEESPKKTPDFKISFAGIGFLFLAFFLRKNRFK